jgi:cytochrome c oxidase subunit 2
VGTALFLVFGRKSGAAPLTRSQKIWTMVPAALLLVLFAWGWQLNQKLGEVPADAMEIHVVAKQWFWTFEYPDGRRSEGDLYAPVNRAIKLVLSSNDVTHSFLVPTFRLKQDIFPGTASTIFFVTKEAGKHRIYCAEICGPTHSGMLGKLIVLDEPHWQDWLAHKPLPPELTEIPN